MKAVIMAGGKGTRISSIANQIPKPLIKIHGKPVLEHEILKLKEYGISEIIIAVGHLGQQIIDYFGDGSSLGVKINYFFENEPLGNAGALFEIKNDLTDDFLLLSGDIVFDVDFDRIVEFHKNKKGLATIVAHPNSHPYDSDLVQVDNNDCVIGWILKNGVRPEYYRNLVNAGIHILSKKILKKRPKNVIVDLNRDILDPIVKSMSVFAYETSEYIKDMGTPERFKQVSDDFEKGVIERKSLRKKQRAIFLDRDGTINEYDGFITKPAQIKLIDGAANAIRNINNSSFLAIVVTNQPVIARGDVTFKELNKIHNKLETLLGEEGCYLDAIYFCPHHPDKGFDGEIPELKIDCDCRKPKPGLLIKAASRYNIDLSKSWIIGDGDIDILAGQKCGCRTILIGKQPTMSKPEFCANSLYDAVEIIMRNEND